MDSCCVPTNGLLVLVQQWYNGLGPADQYTLHGLWPDTCTGGLTPSSGCDASRVYSNVGTIIQNYNPTLYNQMSMYWPSYTGDNNSFWSHEWSKHGTCVTTLDPSCYTSYTQYQDVNDYFAQVLGLRSKYDYYTALKNRGIVPTTGKTFTAAAFKAAIKAELGIDVVLKCSSGTLSEIWTWFNVQNKSTYVPTSTWVSDTCTTFTYPPKY
ncbi:ribonuclease T2 [Linderina pennispora]|uniref:ribonuclease T2 n=1 Tax=Linderina pennispora TaxID=61395 RepID=A0A1Y1WHL6_9FUNG|nr:ribonuclease T2 [Linderina pennispora]ORX73003.1 ribonuclease T2 [Linderina pennispora]